MTYKNMCKWVRTEEWDQNPDSVVKTNVWMKESLQTCGTKGQLPGGEGLGSEGSVFLEKETAVGKSITGHF